MHEYDRESVAETDRRTMHAYVDRYINSSITGMELLAKFIWLMNAHEQDEWAREKEGE
jgi:hypothetical protein